MRGIADDEARAIIDETLAVLHHPEFASLFGPTSRGEITITAELPEIAPGVAISGQIDRIVTRDKMRDELARLVAYATGADPVAAFGPWDRKAAAEANAAAKAKAPRKAKAKSAKES